jgi:hypothetical protein
MAAQCCNGRLRRGHRSRGFRPCLVRMAVSARARPRFMPDGPAQAPYQPSGNGMNGQASWLSFAVVCSGCGIVSISRDCATCGAAEATGATNLAAHRRSNLLSRSRGTTVITKAPGSWSPRSRRPQRARSFKGPPFDRRLAQSARASPAVARFGRPHDSPQIRTHQRAS